MLSPHSIVKGKGARIIDVDGNEFIDWGMGLSSVILGHAYPPIIQAIKDELGNGSNFIRPSFIEAEFAEQFCDQIPSIDMVKFAKNGSNATTSAIRLARAYTNREIICRCIDNPFLSIDDWFISDTQMNSGVDKSSKEKIINFKYNDKEDFKKVIQEYKYQGIACVILEPSSLQEPKNGFLQYIRKICDLEGIVLIFDEIVSGFRFHPKGAGYLYGVDADLSTFGKSMANGYSLSALGGKREIMELGGLYHKQERVFLLSTTYGGETHHLRAGQQTMKIINENEVSKYIWNVGQQMKTAYNEIAKYLQIDNHTSMQGVNARPYFHFTNTYLRTLFAQEMIKHGVLIQSINPSYSHQKSEISQSIEAFEKSLKVVAMEIESNNKLLVGDVIKPVFRRFN